MRAAASCQVVERGEEGPDGLHLHTCARGDVLPGRRLDAAGEVELEGALDDALAGGIDVPAGRAGLVAGRALEASADRLAPERAVERHGLWRLFERATAARAQLPEHLAAHFS